MSYSQHLLVMSDDEMLLCLQPAPDDTSTELDPKYRISYLSPHEVAVQPSHTSEQEEAVAAAFAFSQLEASLSGVATSASNAEAISRQGMTASTSGTTATTDHGKLITLSHALTSHPCTLSCHASELLQACQVISMPCISYCGIVDLLCHVRMRCTTQVSYMAACATLMPYCT